jgi:hypothetical protein
VVTVTSLTRSETQGDLADRSGAWIRLIGPFRVGQRDVLLVARVERYAVGIDLGPLYVIGKPSGSVAVTSAVTDPRLGMLNT